MGRRKRAQRPDNADQGMPGAPSGAPGGGLRWLRVELALPACCAVLLGAAVAAWLLAGGGSPPPAARAVIVDQLSLTQPNESFAAAAIEKLEEAGYAVEYVPGEQVTVDFYRYLPALDYDLVIVRAHSGQLWLGEEAEDSAQESYVSLFTGEPYSGRRYVEEQKDARVVEAVYYEGGDPIFAVSSGFVETSMEGRFDGSVVVLMGCEGLGSDRTARAFLERGASAVVGWDEQVSAARTDEVTERLLDALAAEGLDDVEGAVAETVASTGSDDEDGGELRVILSDS